METLSEMVKRLTTGAQNKGLSPSQIAQFEHHLHMAFRSGLHTPDHPPYADMIYKAITKLDEEGGSFEESISECIKAEYKDLPFAHKSILSLHLSRLCDKELIVFTAAKRYKIRDLSVASSEMVCATPPPSNEHNSCLRNKEHVERNKPRKTRRTLVFDKGDEHDEIFNAVSNKLTLEMEEKSFDGKTKGGSSKGLSVKRKNKKDVQEWMDTAFSDLPDEDKPEEIHTPYQITQYNEPKDPSCVLEALLEIKFFDECKVHLIPDYINKCNWYCMDCMNGALCNSCRFSHKNHNLIRISQSMWENAVVVSKIQKYIDISDIQTHLLNRIAYVSLKRTSKSVRRKHFRGVCLVCKRYLPDSFKFCSLFCKVTSIGEKPVSLLPNKKFEHDEAIDLSI